MDNNNKDIKVGQIVFTPSIVEEVHDSYIIVRYLGENNLYLKNEIVVESIEENKNENI